MDENEVIIQLERVMNLTKQTWLLGAGISFDANIPLMFPLTKIVILNTEEFFKNPKDKNILELLNFICNDCGEKSHIEHHLTHLGDLISFSERSKEKEIKISGIRASKDDLLKLYNKIIELISTIIRFGYPKEDNAKLLEPSNSSSCIIKIENHLKFTNAIFNVSRAGLNDTRSPVEFFTTNYDTLLEDSLALNGVKYVDGFNGGAVAYYDHTNYLESKGIRAKVFKLHGSIDWVMSDDNVSKLKRIRYGDGYTKDFGSVMIYPQATKYLNTQKDPFSQLFQKFRERLTNGKEQVLNIVGYSFGDEHINDEIEIALSNKANQLTLIVFVCEQGDNGLPNKLQEWLLKRWADKIYIISNKGIYNGQNIDEASPNIICDEKYRDLWKFDKVINLIQNGLPNDYGAIK